MPNQEPKTEQVADDEPLTDADEAPDGEEPTSGAGYGNHAQPDEKPD